MTEDEMLRAINARIAALAAECAAYGAKLRASDSSVDDRTAFEGWVIRKIAGLEVVVERLADALQDRTRQTARPPRGESGR